MDTRSARRRTRTRTVDLELPAAVRHDASDDRAGAVGAVRGAPRAGVDRAREASRASVQTNFDTCVRICSLHASRRLQDARRQLGRRHRTRTVHPATLDIDCSYVRTERRTPLEHVNREKSEKTIVVSRARLNAHTTASTKRVAYVFSERGKSELQRQPGARNRAIPGARAPRTGPRRDRASPFFPRERPRRGVLWDI